jgi:ABC-type glycerol-3-phosphate transport system permease component
MSMRNGRTLPSDASQKRSKRARAALNATATHILLAVLGIAFGLPFVWLILSSLKTDPQMLRFPPQWIPNPIMWRNYVAAFNAVPFLTYFKNTVFISGFNATAIAVTCSLAAYGFSRIRWPGREALFWVLISSMLLPFAVLMVPLFILFTRLGWVDSFKAMTLPYLLGFGGAYLIFMLRQFFRSIPSELSDAARMDGCSEFGIYFRIILPLSKPAIVTTWLIEFMWHWNDFLRPLIFLKDPAKYTLALGLYGFNTYRMGQWSLLMAATTLTILPIVIVFFFAQRFFIQGISMTGTKG